jgi:hypothetical protein
MQFSVQLLMCKSPSADHKIASYRSIVPEAVCLAGSVAARRSGAFQHARLPQARCACGGQAGVGGVHHRRDNGIGKKIGGGIFPRRLAFIKEDVDSHPRLCPLTNASAIGAEVKE